MARKLITLDGLGVFLAEIRKEIKAAAGNSLDQQELARRIPSWQWKVTLPKSENQTVTATVNGKSYTETFYAQQGSRVEITVKSDPGYIPGTLSHTSFTLNSDVEVTITDAAESEELEPGEYIALGGSDRFTVPPKVRTILFTHAGEQTYLKVEPGRSFTMSVNAYEKPASPSYDDWGKSETVTTYDFFYLRYGDNTASVDLSPIVPGLSVESETPPTFSWSKEINEHAVDFDLTKPIR